MNNHSRLPSINSDFLNYKLFTYQHISLSYSLRTLSKHTRSFQIILLPSSSVSLTTLFVLWLLPLSNSNAHACFFPFICVTLDLHQVLYYKPFPSIFVLCFQPWLLWWSISIKIVMSLLVDTLILSFVVLGKLV